ncbi:MAG TPA: TraR/DksA C4-type zinc finger protein [Balneolales bacterium]|nr:TraR/DksA C4-type zinc finger protein [Balneolales bacterium]
METLTKNPNIENRITPYSDEELEYFRGIILRKRKDAVNQMEMFKRSLRESVENESDESVYSFHMADAGTDVMDRERNYLMYYRTRKFINYLDAAIKRIDNGTYGVCKVTGKKIAKERLEAVPHTQLCIEAKLRRR